MMCVKRLHYFKVLIVFGFAMIPLSVCWGSSTLKFNGEGLIAATTPIKNDSNGEKKLLMKRISRLSAIRNRCIEQAAHYAESIVCDQGDRRIVFQRCLLLREQAVRDIKVDALNNCYRHQLNALYYRLNRL